MKWTKWTVWAVWTMWTVVALSCCATAYGQTQGDGAAQLQQTTDFVSGVVQKTASAHPWIVGAFLVLAVLRVCLKPVMTLVENACANDPAKEAAVRNFEASWWFHALCWVLDWTASIKLKQTIVAATVCVVLCLCLALPANAQGTQGTNGTQTTTTTTPAPTIQAGVQEIADAFMSGQTNWYVIPYGLYAPGLTKHFGGGLAAMYPLSQYVVTGIRMDYVNGGFWMPSGNATLQVPIKINNWLTVTPFGYVGVGVPVSGATVAGFTLPGQTPKDNNGQPTAILGYGAAIHLYDGAGFIKQADLVGDAETWTGFPGQQYRFGAALKF